MIFSKCLQFSNRQSASVYCRHTCFGLTVNIKYALRLLPMTSWNVALNSKGWDGLTNGMFHTLTAGNTGFLWKQWSTQGSLYFLQLEDRNGDTKKLGKAFSF